MGVSLPDLPPSTAEGNVNLGDKDSIRRRALWALEGKSDVPFSKVEIPELSTPVMEKLMFDICESFARLTPSISDISVSASKSSAPQSDTPSYGQSINTLMANKRDSFKLLAPSSSSKDQLHTLVEEEEEEDDLEAKYSEPIVEIPETPISATSTVSPTESGSSRRRPPNLSLRPLSLSPQNLISVVNGPPTPTPTPLPRPGLKSLALTPSASIIDDSTNITNTMKKSRALAASASSPRPPLSINISATETPSISPSPMDKPTRRSSIGYKSSSTPSDSISHSSGLPTPEMTPTTFDRRYSISDSARNRGGTRGTAGSSDDEFFLAHQSQGKSLSVREQHFLFKSHNALLARITDLEQTLSLRRRDSSAFSSTDSSRPVSAISDFSSNESGSNGNEPSDEMLRLLADLKAERDELKRDVDGWRMRVGDMEKHLGNLTKRVETERRDAWIARSMVGLLEVEKSTLEKKHENIEKTMAYMENEKNALAAANEAAKHKINVLEAELARVKRELEEVKNARQEAVESGFQADAVTPTLKTMHPRSRPPGFTLKGGLRFTSLDSEGSATDVDDLLEESTNGYPLKAVTEESEEVLSEEENGLAGYEDEEDTDLSFRSSSSFDSDDESPRSLTHLEIDDVRSSATPSSRSGSGTPTVVSRSTSPTSDISSRPTHISRASLSRTWTFPKGIHTSTITSDRDAEVDRFFGCLEDCDGGSSSGSVPGSPSLYSYEKHKGVFASGFKYDAGHEDGLFFLPGGLGFEDNAESKGLAAVAEEEEDEDDAKTQVDEDEDEEMFGEAGGIMITFTPPAEADDAGSDIQHSPSPVKKSHTMLNFLGEEDEAEAEAAVPFNFGRPVVRHTAIVSTPRSGLVKPPSALPRPTPSSIPRPTTSKTASLSLTSSRSMPSASSSPPAFNPSVTPPIKRGSPIPSFIPQAVSSPSPIRSIPVLGKAKASSTSIFIRQPERKPLMVTNNHIKSQIPLSGPNGSTFKTQIPTMCTYTDPFILTFLVNPAMNTRSVRRSPETPPTTRPTSEMKSVGLSGDHNTRTSLPATTLEYPAQDCDISRFTPPASTTPPGSSTSSFSSIMSSPLTARISFQTLTNFIPAVWSSGNHVPESVTPSCFATRRLSSGPALDDSLSSSCEQTRELVGVTSKRGYVSKEKQLEKLRGRLEQEGVVRMRTSVHFCCKKCDDEVVFL
jgi:hypothetical protein